MATMAGEARRRVANDHRFFLWLAIAAAALNVAGFSVQLGFGRSSFGAPPLVHLHALVFFGWVALYLTQNALVAGGSIALHRRLGWVGAGWAVAMVVVGITITVVMVRAGRAPFFFLPASFLLMNPASVLCFAALVGAAIRLRRRTEWHRRLMACGMAAIMGPAFGRLLPMPLLIPYAIWGVFAAMMLFPLAGVIHDRRRHGRVHPAWWWGIAALTGNQLLIEALVATPIAPALYRAATANSPGAAIDPLAYQPFP
jgi:hypothetical protein